MYALYLGDIGDIIRSRHLHRPTRIGSQNVASFINEKIPNI